MGYNSFSLDRCSRIFINYNNTHLEKENQPIRHLSIIRFMYQLSDGAAKNTINHQPAKFDRPGCMTAVMFVANR